MKRWLAVLSLIALVGAGCASDDDDEATTDTTAASGASGVTVQVDGTTDDLKMGSLAYFPKNVTVKAGETVTFHSNDTGEPHTVTFGTLVNDAVEAFKALTPEQLAELDQDESKVPPALTAVDEKLPPLLPDGPGDANQASANPCFVAGGDPPTDAACPKVEQPAFDGTHTVFNSGYLADDDEFEVALADDLAPGTYNYFCLLHRVGMTGSITVVADDAETDTQADVTARGTEELEALAAQLKPQADRQAAFEGPTAGAPLAEGDENIEGLLASFGPEEVKVKAGEAVTWSVFGPHTIAVNVGEDAVGAFVKAPDGSWHANEKAFAPVGGPGAPPPSEEAPAPDAKPVLVDGGTFDGTAPHSSGIILSFGPPGYQYKLTFAKAGTYNIVCQIHPDMTQRVTVA